MRLCFMRLSQGNYSGRFYMALNAGRIPIVIDTDVVIPHEEKIHFIKISVNSLDRIGDIILEHFEKTTDREFWEMKLENRAIYNQFLAPDKFIPNFIKNVLNEKLSWGDKSLRSLSIPNAG